MEGDQTRKTPVVEFHPLTPERWADLERLFGKRGACGGCWCMYWRLPRSLFDRQKGEGNRKALHAVVASGQVPGLLAYAGGVPIGWCSVAPRTHFPALQRSRILKKVDDLAVWSVVCFFVDKQHRRQGLSVHLLRAAVEYVKKQNGEALEGYPIEPKKGDMPAPFVWTGLASTFREVGFQEILRRSETRPIMRYFIPQG